MAGTPIDQLINALVGAAFGVRALDDRRKLWARIAYGAVGVDLLRAAYESEPVLQPQGVGKASASTVEGKVIKTSTGGATVPLKFKEEQVKSVAERVSYIHKQALAGTRDPQVYSLARAVVSKKCGEGWCIPERDHKGEITALFNEVRKRVRYTLDPTSFDAFQTPQKTLALQTGDCDDQTSLLAAMLRTIGMEVKTCVVQTTGWSTFNHIYLAAQIPGTKTWMPLDPTVNQPAGWEVPQTSVIKRKDFPVKGD